MVSFDYGNKDKNPIDNVRCYHKSSPDKSDVLRKEEVCCCFFGLSGYSRVCGEISYTWRLVALAQLFVDIRR